MHTLGRSYRTHDRILALANVVVGLLTDKFPGCIDKLTPESSRVGGPKPLFVEYSSNACDFFNNSAAQEFGAEQAVLVRSDAEVAALEARGVRALTLTVVESKGLEFDDILVYDFWVSSPFKAWRVLYNFSSDEDASSNSRPQFDPKTHSDLINELKLLYVAVTRARKKLCFLDSDPKRSHPFLSLVQELVETGPIEDFFHLEHGTTSAEWKVKGEHIFHMGNFREARKCFRYAGAVEWERVAEAWLLK
jgi:hypothetical protein